jgi:hypothetical protein
MFINSKQPQSFILTDLMRKSTFSADNQKYITSKYFYEFLAGRTKWHHMVKHTIPTNFFMFPYMTAVECHVKHDIRLHHRCKNHGRQVTCANKFCVVAPSVCWSSVAKLFHFTFMGSRILTNGNSVSYIYRLGILQTPQRQHFINLVNKYPYQIFWDILHYLFLLRYLFGS